jgi:hypothetical protein
MRAKRTVTTRLELLTLLRAALGLTQAEAESQGRLPNKESSLYVHFAQI